MIHRLLDTIVKNSSSFSQKMPVRQECFKSLMLPQLQISSQDIFGFFDNSILNLGEHLEKIR